MRQQPVPVIKMLIRFATYALLITTTTSLKICSCKTVLTYCSAHELFAILSNFFFKKITSSGNIALVYALTVPELCLVVLAGCER